MQQPLITPAEAAALLGITVDELTALRRAGDGPDHYLVTVRIVRYDPDSVDDYKRRRKVEPDVSRSP